MNHNTLYIIQIAVSIILIISVLLQSRGSGLSSAFGGTSGGGEFYRSRRGIEKFLYYETIVMAIVFATTSVLLVVAK